MLGKRELVALLLFFLMYCNCWYSAPLPHGTVGWSAVYGCGVSCPYPLAFLSRGNFNVRSNDTARCQPCTAGSFGQSIDKFMTVADLICL